MKVERQKLAVVALLLALFLLGVASGVLAAGFFRPGRVPAQGPSVSFPSPPPPGSIQPPPPGEIPEAVMAEFRHRLNLSEAQTETVREALSQAKRDADRLLTGLRPELDASFKKARDTIRAVLEPQQAVAFEQLLSEQLRPPPALGADRP